MTNWTKEIFKKHGTMWEREHIIVAERALGKPLPKNAIVHHIDENRSNNANSNLLICTRSYHLLIHKRLRALKACGNADWRSCRICKQYDHPTNMKQWPNRDAWYHRACAATYSLEGYYRRKRENNSQWN